VATDTERLILSVSADVTQIRRELEKLGVLTRNTAKQMENNLDGVGGAAKRMAANTNVAGAQMERSIRQTRQATVNLTAQFNDITQQLAAGVSPFTIMAQQGSQVTQALQAATAGAGSATGAFKAMGGAIASMFSIWNIGAAAAILGIGYTIDWLRTSEAEIEQAEKAQKKLNDELQRQQNLVRDVVKEWEGAPAAMQGAVKTLNELEQLRNRREAIGITRRDLLKPLTDEMAAAQPKVDKFFDMFEGFDKFADDIGAVRSQWAVMFAQLQTGGASVGEVNAFLETLIALLESLPIPAAKALAAEFREIQTEVAGVTPQIRELTTAMEELGTKSNSALTLMLQGLQALHGPLGPLIEAMKTFAASIPSDAFANLLNAPAGFDALTREAFAGSPSEAKEFLKTKAVSDKIRVRIDALDDEFASALAQLFTILPAGATIGSAARTYAEQAELYAKHKRGGGLAAPPGRSHHEQRGLMEPAAADIWGVDPETLAAAVAQVEKLEQLKGRAYAIDKVHVQLKGQSAKADKDAAQAVVDKADEEYKAAEKLAEKAREGQEAYEEEIATQQKAIDTQIRHNEMMVDSTRTIDQRKLAVEADTIAQQLNEAATKNGIVLTDELRAKHQALAMSMAQAKFASDSIAQAQRDAAKATEEQRRAMEQLQQQLAGIAQSAVSGFIQDLRNGVNAGDAFLNMLNRVIDGLIQMALQALFSKNMLGGLFGGGGAIGSLFGGFGAATMHKGGKVGVNGTRDGRRFSPALWANAERYQSGGIAGLRANEVPIIAHRGEIIIPTSALQKSSGSRAGTSIQTSLGDVNIDMSQTGLVTANSDDARQFGQSVQKLIQAEMIRESRPGGLLRRAQ
jgi:hypothetical protein